MDSFNLKQIFKRYLEGNATARENKEVDDWYSKNEEKIPVSLKAEKEAEIREIIWMEIAPELIKDTILQPRRSGSYTWMKVAASVLLVLAAGLIWFKVKQPAHQHLSSYSTIATKAGERKVITLSDGSSLALNSASLIRIATDFSTRRKVEILDGEVYFSVTHNVKKPFIVQSGTMTTQVLGTSFNIRAYKELNKFSVSVTSGKVGVMIPGQTVNMLVKGRQLVYNKQRNLVSVTALDPHLLEWQNGSLILSDASFEEMAVLVHKNFNIRVSTSSEQISKQHFTATLNMAMTASQAVEVIAAIHQRNIKKRRDTIEIY